MKKILLHVCCGPCSLGAIERLEKEGKIVLFFSNSNIYPKEEYKKRAEEVRKMAGRKGWDLIEEVYEHERWLKEVKGLEEGKEGGKRCEKCWEFNLRRAKEKAEELGAELWTTTLTVSPHKKSEKILEIGKEVGGRKFLEIDFKKKEGFKRSVDLARKYNLYRQNYCGCEFSLKRNIASPKE